VTDDEIRKARVRRPTKQEVEFGPEEAKKPMDGKCNGDKGEGFLCRNPAGKGTSHLGFGRCKNHGGATQSHAKAAEKAIAAQAVVTYGLSREVDPRDALLEEVYRTAGAVDFLAEQVRAIEAKDLVWGVTKESDQQATEFEGVNVDKEAKPNIWLVLYQQERKHLVDVCKAAIGAGIEERKVRVAEQFGSQLAAFVRFILGGLALTPEQWEQVPALMAAAGRQLGLTA
jgi:hypothetical protein